MSHCVLWCCFACGDNFFLTCTIFPIFLQMIVALLSDNVSIDKHFLRMFMTFLLVLSLLLILLLLLLLLLL